MPIQLTADNYYSKQANLDYMSVSQFKDFAGTIAHTSCEDVALKKVNEQIITPKTTPLLVGSYIDAYFEGTLDEFRENTPELFKKTGDKGLKSEYIQAEEIITRINNDPLFTQFMSGEKQKIMAANIFNTPWKIKMDSYHAGNKIVDLKIMKDMKPIWSDLKHCKIDFIRYWGYDIQGAIYQKVVELTTGQKLPFFLAVATKENPIDIQIIEITQPYLDEALEFVAENIEHVLLVKNGTIAPTKCGECFWCKSNKILTAPISIEDIMPIQYGNPDATNEDVPAHGYSLFDN